MPTYPYECQECGHEFEEFHEITAEPLKTCPKCNKDSLKRMIYGGSGKGIVQLYGQDLKDKIYSDAKKIRAEAHKNENVMANLVGENKFHNGLK